MILENLKFHVPDVEFLREDSQIDFVTRNVPWTFLLDPHPPSEKRPQV